MNYFLQIRGFYDLQLSKRFSTGQIALWHGLMHINNKCGWIEWFTVPNATLELLTGLSKKGIQAARDSLREAGVLEMEFHGRKATGYHLRKLYFSETTPHTAREIAPTSTLPTTPNKAPLVKQDHTLPYQETPYTQIVALYHTHCQGKFPPIMSLTEKRKQVITERFVEYGKEIGVFEELFAHMADSLFLQGHNKQHWKATFDWAMKACNFPKILEGQYQDQTVSSAGGDGDFFDD